MLLPLRALALKFYTKCTRNGHLDKRETYHITKEKYWSIIYLSITLIENIFVFFFKMDPISLLEKRIEALELQILPRDRTSITKKTTDVTTLLMETQTMITSALSCREAITSMLQHMTTINEYLDPNAEANELEVEAKRHYLLELYPELKDTIQTIGTFESLLPYIDSVNILKVAELSDKIEQLAVGNWDIYAECKEVTHKVLKSLQQYNDITHSIKILFAQLDTAVTVLEDALQPRFVTEE
ncbi:hypothetical protein JTB14_001205 [Gonioctena quinquepunctata]|nr:hypothetical protein JTB14_001205 [Gonioctena quinquepunctata]